MPESLREKVAKAARDSGRSLTAEILQRLEASFEQQDALDELSERVESIDGTVSDNTNRIERLEDQIRDILSELHSISRAL